MADSTDQSSKKARVPANPSATDVDAKNLQGEIYLFSHGCNGIDILAARIGADAQEVKSRSFGAIVRGYTRAFGGLRSRNWGEGGVSTLIAASEAAETLGTATRVTAEEIEKVDKFESWPTWYRHERLTIHIRTPQEDGSYALEPKQGFAYVQVSCSVFAPPCERYLCAIAANVGSWFGQDAFEGDEQSQGERIQYVTIDVRNAINGRLHSVVTFVQRAEGDEWRMLRPFSYHVVESDI